MFVTTPQMPFYIFKHVSFHRFTSNNCKLKPTSGLKTKLVWKTFLVEIQALLWWSPSSLQSGVRFFSYINISCSFWVIFHDTFSLTVKEAESDEWVGPFIISTVIYTYYSNAIVFFWKPIPLVSIYYCRVNQFS